MTYAQWKAKYCIQGNEIDWDKTASVQCLDLPKCLWECVYGIPMTKGKAAFGNACDYWNIDNPSWVGYKAGINSYFFRIANTPEFVTIEGDIAIWGSAYSANHKCGHIALCLGTGTLSKFKVAEQNRLGKNDPITFNYQTYKKDFKGVLRPYRWVKKAVNIRNMPSSVNKGTQILGELQKGTRVAIYEVKGNWGKISKLEDKWISLNYLKELGVR